jgi:hypothetical protein
MKIDLIKGLEWLLDLAQMAEESPDNTYHQKTIRTFHGKSVGEYSLRVRVGLPAQVPIGKKDAQLSSANYPCSEGHNVEIDTVPPQPIYLPTIPRR